jgi:hypothetical protein
MLHYCIFRWIYHHYLAMIMALVSLTWEINGQPECSSKQVCPFFSWSRHLLVLAASTDLSTTLTH